VWGGPTPQQSVQDKANSQQLATQNKPNLSASWQGLRTDVRNKMPATEVAFTRLGGGPGGEGTNREKVQ
jgi:hypothetical protein